MEILDIPLLEAKIDTIKDILKGWYLPLSAFYNKKDKYGSVEALSQELSGYLPKGVKEDEKTIYMLFFNMAITYIESSCNDDDKILVSIRKLSGVVARDEHHQSTFDLMMENVEDYYRTKEERRFWDICKSLHSDFRNILLYEPEHELFKTNIVEAIEQYLIEKNCFMSEDKLKGSTIETQIDGMISQVKNEYRHYILGNADE